jgi:glucan phosphoethanolaminetransferase (alkaline phosphatase superfamily)
MRQLVATDERPHEPRTVVAVPARRTALEWVLIGVVVVGLAVDSIVHFDLATAFPHNKTSVLSEAELFRAEATVSAILALAVLLRPRRYTAALAFLVAASAFVVVVVYRYVNVGKIGPIPNMYDPYWAPAGKALSAIGEAVAALASATLVAILPAGARDATAAQRQPAANRA